MNLLADHEAKSPRSIEKHLHRDGKILDEIITKNYIGFVDQIYGGRIRGWCQNLDDENAAVTLGVYVDGTEVVRTRANLPRLDLYQQGIGTGLYGFETSLCENSPAPSAIKVIPIGGHQPLPCSTSEIYPAGHIDFENKLEQRFVAELEHLSHISLRVVAGSDLSLLRIQVIEIDAEIENVVVDSTERADQFRDQEAVDLYFLPRAHSAGREYIVRAWAEGLIPGPSLYITSGQFLVPGHRSCTIGSKSIPEGLFAVLGYSPPLSAFTLPPRILYSPVTQCNLNCVHCISRSTRTTASRIDERIKEQIQIGCRSGQIHHIYTDYSGDILWADHRWPGELDFLISLDVPFHIDTNGAHLTSERSERLLGSRLASLNISLDAATPETYRRIRKGAPHLAIVVENAIAFARIRTRASVASTVPFSLGFTLMRSNLDELGAFIELAADIGADRVECRHLEAFTPDMVGESLWHEPERYNDALSSALKTARKCGVQLGIEGPLHQRLSSEGHRFCVQPWSAALILGNGDVNVCCLPGTKIGNIHENSLAEIWNGAAYQEFRNIVNSNKAPDTCNACAYNRKSGNIYSYMPALKLHNK